MTSKVQSSSRKSSWLVAVVVATIFAQSALAQVPGGATQTAVTEPAPASAPAAGTEPAPAAQPTDPLATSVQGDDLITKRGLDIDSSVLMREQDRRMVDQFLLAIAVFFAVIAFLLFVSLPPRKPGDS